MKTQVYVEIEFKGNEVFNDIYKIDEKFSFINSYEQLIENEQINKKIGKIYGDIISKYPICAKIKYIFYTFLNDNNDLLGIIEMYKINRKTYNFKMKYYKPIKKGINNEN